MNRGTLGPALGVAALNLGSVAAAAPNDAPLDERVRRMEERIAEQDAEIERLRQASSDVGVARAVRVPAGTEVEDAVGVGDAVHVDGVVRGDAVSVGSDVVVGPGGHVRGDAVAIGGQVVVAAGGRIDGDRVALGLSAPPLPAGPDRHAAGSLVLGSPLETLRWLQQRMVWMLAIGGASAVTIGLFPNRVAQVARDVEARPVRSGLVGAFASVGLLLFAALFVAMTVGVGSPVSLAIVAMLFAAWLLGFVAFCQAVGDKLPIASKPQARWLSLLVGVMVLGFASLLPWVGWLALAGISAIGVGASLSTRFGRVSSG